MANEIFATILQNQNQYIREGEAARVNLDDKVTAALDALEELSRREYDFAHTPIVTEALETDYNKIIQHEPELADSSAIGFTAIIFNGASITTQGNRLFINGLEEDEAYQFSAENSEGGIELVKVWYFENNGAAVNLNIDTTFFLFNLVVKYINANPTIVNLEDVETLNAVFENDYMTSARFFNTATNLTYNNTKPTTSQILPSSAYIPLQTTYFYSNCSEITTGAATGTLSPFYVSGGLRQRLRKVLLPELVSISKTATNGRSGFNGCTMLEIKKEDIPKLVTVEPMANHYGAFGGVKSVELPETVALVGAYSFSGAANSTSLANHEIKLYCKNATFEANWCNISVTDNFWMCDDWAATINIATAARNVWTTITPYINLINNLRNMTLTSETRSLTIPQTVYNQLQADPDGAAALTAAEAKGWTIGW